MSQLARVFTLCLLSAAACHAHRGVINLYVNPTNNQLYPFEPFFPAQMYLFPGIEISAPFPGFGVSLPSNGVAVGARLETSTTLGLLYWDGARLAPTSAQLTVEAPMWDNDGEQNDSPVPYYVVARDTVNLSGMVWGTYSGANYWEADGLYLLNPLDAPTGIYGLALRLDAAEHEMSAPFLFPFVYDPADQLTQAEEDAGVARLRQTVLADVNYDGVHDCQDIDLLVDDIVSQRNTPEMDLTTDGLVNHDDLAVWLEVAGRTALGSPFLPGDANLDGEVNGIDYETWKSHKFMSMPAWCAGDFDADGFVTGSDLLIWNAHKSSSSLPTTPLPLPIPEPATTHLVAMMLAVLWRRSVG